MTGFAVVILAGGESTRIGGGKPLRRLGGRTLLDRALALARGWSNDVAVSVRSGEQVADLELPVLTDDPDLAGPLAGLGAALRHARDRAQARVLTIPCDMPFLPADLALRLEEAFADDVAAALASSGGFLHSVCALWSASAIEKLPGFVETGRRSLHGFAETIGFTAVAWPSEPFDPFFNINDEDDLRTAEAMLRD